MNPDLQKEIDVSVLSDLYNNLLNQKLISNAEYIKHFQQMASSSISYVAPPTPTSHVAYQYDTNGMTDLEDIHGIAEVPKPVQDVLEDKMHSCVREMTSLLYYASGARPRSTSEITQYKERLAENLLAMYNHTGEISHLMYTKLQEREDGQNIIESSV